MVDMAMVGKSILRKPVDVKGVIEVAQTYVVDPAGAAMVTMAENARKPAEVIKEAENMSKGVGEMENLEMMDACMPRTVDMGQASRIMF